MSCYKILQLQPAKLTQTIITKDPYSTTITTNCDPLDHLLHPVQARGAVEPPQTLSPVVQRHGEQDREHGDGELSHVYRDPAVFAGGGDVEDPVREGETEL